MVTERVSVSIVGGSGYAGGELLRLLSQHPFVDLQQVTSERFVGKYVTRHHPNLRKVIRLAYSSLEDLQPCDTLFVCLPHGESQKWMPTFRNLAKKIIDLGADFRLNNRDGFIYGIPELHRDEMKGADLVSSAGCNATATILALYPFYKRNLVDPNSTVVEVKTGSSEGGYHAKEDSHHPERAGVIRSYKPTGHRHIQEILQEVSFGRDISIHFSATAVDLVRGALATCHLFLTEPLTEKDVWKILREEYGSEPFIRIVKEREGCYRYPEPKILAGTNYCDIGFERDAKSNRLVVLSAIDNLMKGAAGQAVQAFNLMHGFEETTALTFTGLHPI